MWFFINECWTNKKQSQATKSTPMKAFRHSIFLGTGFFDFLGTSPAWAAKKTFLVHTSLSTIIGARVPPVGPRAAKKRKRNRHLSTVNLQQARSHCSKPSARFFSLLSVRFQNKKRALWFLTTIQKTKKLNAHCGGQSVAAHWWIQEMKFFAER